MLPAMFHYDCIMHVCVSTGYRSQLTNNQVNEHGMQLLPMSAGTGTNHAPSLTVKMFSDPSLLGREEPEKEADASGLGMRLMPVAWGQD